MGLGEDRNLLFEFHKKAKGANQISSPPPVDVSGFVIGGSCTYRVGKRALVNIGKIR